MQTAIDVVRERGLGIVAVEDRTLSALFAVRDARILGANKPPTLVGG